MKYYYHYHSPNVILWHLITSYIILWHPLQSYVKYSHHVASSIPTITTLRSYSNLQWILQDVLELTHSPLLFKEEPSHLKIIVQHCTIFIMNRATFDISSRNSTTLCPILQAKTCQQYHHVVPHLASWDMPTVPPCCAPSCKLRLAKFSTRLKLQDRLSVARNIKVLKI